MQVVESFFCCMRGDMSKMRDTRKLYCSIRVSNRTGFANNCFNNNRQSSTWSLGKSSKRLTSQLIIGDNNFRADYLTRIPSFE